MPLNRRKSKPSGRTALIDGDVVVYAVGFASDKRTYTCPDGKVFDYKKEAKAHAMENDLSVDEITTEISPDSIENCLHSVKHMVNGIIEKAGASNHIVYLSGKGNYRDDLNPLYKISRKGTAKPTHFYAIREYLETVWKAEVTVGQEADDAMGIAQMNGKDTIICTVDKDLDMIPGLHYNWKREEVYTIDELTGYCKFYEQMLKGDNVDDIIAIYGIGDVRAREMLEEYDTEEDFAQQTQLAYAEHGLTREQYINNGQLLWIRRQENELWTPPKIKRTEWLDSYMQEMESKKK